MEQKYRKEKKVREEWKKVQSIHLYSICFCHEEEEKIKNKKRNNEEEKQRRSIIEAFLRTFVNFSILSRRTGTRIKQKQEKQEH